MRQTQTLLFIILFITLSIHAKAQKMDVADSIPSEKQKLKVKSKQENFIKFNLTSIPLKNYSLQYERTLSKRISIAASFRLMPSSTLPFKNQILKAVGDDPEAANIINDSRLSNYAITPQIKFYLFGKGYGQGFYVSPFYRYANFKTNQFTFTYENNLGEENKIHLSGEYTSNTGGIMFGNQWKIGKHFCLDWWILGAHYGTGSGKFVGTTSITMTQSEQDDLRAELEDFDIPLTDKTVLVNANGASVKLDGAWGGIVSGFSFGFRF